MKILITIMLVFLLLSCQSALVQDQQAYSEIGQDAWIELNEALTISMDERRVFIQGGQVIHYSELDLYRVNCELEMQTLSDKDRVIQPDQFDIKGISQQSSPIVLSSPYQVASLQLLANSPPDIKRFWIFRLHSEKQPEVRALICRGVQSSDESATLPAIEAMQSALGDLIILHLELEPGS